MHHGEDDPLEGPLEGHPKYVKVRSLSRGGFGFVQLARIRNGEARFAIKFLPRGCDRVNKFLEREILNHRQLWHPHIVKFYEVILTPEHLGIVMEYAPGGNLLDYLLWRQHRDRCRPLTEDDVRWIFQQLMIAIDYCHKKGVVSRDIKLENTLLDDPHHDRPIIKLCDFGFAKDTNKSAPKTRVGTVHYMAPEVVALTRGNAYCGKCSDIWSCGVLLYTLLFGTFPFFRKTDEELTAEAQTQEVMQRIRSLDYTLPAYYRAAAGLLPVSPALRHLLSSILQRVPSERPTTSQVMAHPWFLKDLPLAALNMNHHLVSRPEAAQSEDELMSILDEARTAPRTLLERQESEVEQFIDDELDQQLAGLRFF